MLLAFEVLFSFVRCWFFFLFLSGIIRTCLELGFFQLQYSLLLLYPYYCYYYYYYICYYYYYYYLLLLYLSYCIPIFWVFFFFSLVRQFVTGAGENLPGTYHPISISLSLSVSLIKKKRKKEKEITMTPHSEHQPQSPSRPLFGCSVSPKIRNLF